MRSRRTLSWKDKKFNTVVQGSYGFGSEPGAGSGIAYQSIRGAGPGDEVPGFRQAHLRGMNGIRSSDSGTGLSAAPRGVERERVRILAAMTAAIFLTRASRMMPYRGLRIRGAKYGMTRA
jgi:hypothetical protein